jgi:hypothetical protein
MTSVIDAPAEYKTKEYKSSPLYVLVYQLDSHGRPISYQRLYKKSYSQIVKINKILEFFYGHHRGEGVGGRGKIHLQKLSQVAKIHQAVLRELLLKMACMKQLRMKKGNEWSLVRNEPWILLQQKVKYVSRAKFGKKTCLYILPYKKRQEMANN